jgi:hypothetical protein
MNELHEKIIFVAFLNKRVMSKWYNKLPTAEKRLMGSFQTQWKAFNLAQIKLAREVPSSPMLYPGVSNKPVEKALVSGRKDLRRCRSRRHEPSGGKQSSNIHWNVTNALLVSTISGRNAFHEY